MCQKAFLLIQRNDFESKSHMSYPSIREGREGESEGFG
jgi:hypothetical protein